VWLASESIDELETDGPALAARVLGPQPAHDFTWWVPLERMAPELHRRALKEWNEARASSGREDADAAKVDALLAPFIAAIGDLGDASLAFDVTESALVAEWRLQANGKLGDWLAHYPGGSPRSLLSLPKAHDAMLVRLPESIRDVLDSFMKDEPKMLASAGPGVREAVSLGRALGNEVAIAWDGDWGVGGETTPTNGEILMRIDLADTEAARASIRALSAQLLADGDSNRGTSHYAKYGAEGETITTTSPIGETTVVWAVRAPHFFVDIAVARAPKLLEAATEPGGARLYRTDPRIARALDKFPKEGLAFAFFGLGDEAAGDPESTLRWGWMSATKSGLAGRTSVPLSLMRESIASAFDSVSKAAKPTTE
jgi:hypothetical protein